MNTQEFQDTYRDEITKRTKGILPEHWEDAREKLWMIAHDNQIEDWSDINFSIIAKDSVSKEAATRLETYRDHIENHLYPFVDYTGEFEADIHMNDDTGDGEWVQVANFHPFRTEEEAWNVSVEAIEIFELHIVEAFHYIRTKYMQHLEPRDYRDEE